MDSTDARIASAMQHTGVAAAEATNLLREAGWNVTRAVVGYQQNVSPPADTKTAHSGSDVILRSPVDNMPTSSSKASAQPTKKLRPTRGFSKADNNILILSEARNKILNDAAGCGAGDDHGRPVYFMETPFYTFILPNFEQFPVDFRAFLHKDLIETTVLVTLEQSGYLNWWADLGVGPRLYPMVTSGDGNCLLHSASLAMWGFHDRQLVLRILLSNLMTSSEMAPGIQRRWRWNQDRLNQQYELIYTEDQWREEWEYLVRLSKAEPRISPHTKQKLENRRKCSSSGFPLESDPAYESLEEVHIFALAHVLRRPIIVIAKTVLKDSYGEPLALIPFSGVYLPLECNPSQCHKSPLLLAYDSSHFSALVAMESSDFDTTFSTIPLVDPNLELLPIHFAFDPGTKLAWTTDDVHQFTNPSHRDVIELITRYLDVKLVPLGRNDNERILRRNSWSERQELPKLTIGQQPTMASDDVSKSATLAAGDAGTARKEKKTTRGLQAVTKTINSLGRSFTKKFQPSAHKDGDPRKNIAKKKSVGTATQSTKTAGISEDTLADRSRVLCANMVQHRMFHLNQYVENYLENALQQFNELSIQRNLQNDEIRKLSASQGTMKSSPAAYTNFYATAL